MRILELVKKEYDNFVKENPVEIEEAIEKATKDVDLTPTEEEIKKIEEVLKKEYEDNRKRKFDSLTAGSVYECTVNDKPVLFVVIDYDEKIAVALAMSWFWELADSKSMIVNFDHPLSHKWAVLPIALNLDREFIRNECWKVGDLDKKDTAILISYWIEGELEELPVEKTGIDGEIQREFIQSEIARHMPITFKV